MTSAWTETRMEGLSGSQDVPSPPRDRGRRLSGARRSLLGPSLCGGWTQRPWVLAQPIDCVTLGKSLDF